MDFRVFHGYGMLVRQGIKPALMCDDCDYPLILKGVKVGKDWVPGFWCAWDNHIILPSEDFYKNLRAQVAEFYELEPE